MWWLWFSGSVSSSCIDWPMFWIHAAFEILLFLTVDLCWGTVRQLQTQQNFRDKLKPNCCRGQEHGVKDSVISTNEWIWSVSSQLTGTECEPQSTAAAAGTGTQQADRFIKVWVGVRQCTWGFIDQLQVNTSETTHWHANCGLWTRLGRFNTGRGPPFVEWV